MISRTDQVRFAAHAWNYAIAVCFRALPAGPERETLIACEQRPTHSTIRAVLAIGQHQPWLSLIEFALVEIGIAAIMKSLRRLSVTIAIETRMVIKAALASDPKLASLSIAGASAETLAVHITPGTPARSIGGSSYSPEPPFQRETLVELILRMQRLRWQKPAPFKEKFGGLRFCWYGDLPDLGDVIIQAGEHISRHLCEVCGVRRAPSRAIMAGGRRGASSTGIAVHPDPRDRPVSAGLRAAASSETACAKRD